MHLEYLRTVCQVARHGSITIAAAHLHLTQSGVSRQVQRIEQELGAELFIRHGRHLELTTVGQRFLQFATDTQREYEEIYQEIHDPLANLAGILTISSSSTPGDALVGKLVAQFVALYPNVNVRVTIDDTVAVIEDLLAGRCDVGFAGDHIVDERLAFHPIDDDEIVLIVPVDHRFATRASVWLHEIAGESFIDREAGSGTLRTVRRIVASRGLAMPPYRVLMELGTSHAIIAAVAAGSGLGWVSKQTIHSRDLAGVATVRITDLPLNRSIYMLHRAQRALPAIARTFVDWLLQLTMRSGDGNPRITT